MSETPAPETSEPALIDALTRFWARIKKHKVIQWTLTYIAAALAVVHTVELVSQTFEWPHIVSRVIIVFGLGLPVAVTVAWYHGHRGVRHVSSAEAAIISLLSMIFAVLFLVFIRPSFERAGIGSTARPALESHVASAIRMPARSSASAPAIPAPTASMPLSPATPAAAKLRVAILPFTNLSPDSANEFFTDGLHEEILSALANSAPGLEVISRTTMMIYRTSPKPVTELAKELSCTHVLEGSVRREGDHVRVTLQLIDARSDDHLWSRNYDRKLVSAMTLQSEVASEVASQLSVKLAGNGQAVPPPTTDPIAFDLYLKARLARQGLNTGSPIEDISRTEDLLSQAIVRDPAFALAYVERATLRLVFREKLLDTGRAPARDDVVLRQARDDLATARRLIGGHPAVQGGEALLYFNEDGFVPTRALKAYEAAQAAGLNDPAVLAGLARILGYADRQGEAVAMMEHLVVLDPGNLDVLRTYEQMLELARKPVEALRVLDMIEERFASPAARVDRAWLVFRYTGKADALRAALDGVSQGIDPYRRLIDEFDALRFERRYADLERLLRSSAVLTPNQTPIAVLRGWTYMLLGDAPAAAEQGRALLKAVARESKTEVGLVPRNQLEFLYDTAHGQLFMGDKRAAVATAHKVIAFGATIAAAVPFYGSKIRAARVLAWAGEQRERDEAVSLLEQLSTSDWGLAPAEIARDPIFTMPLADNPRYQALKAKLEAQMAATKLE